jgi:hypothetical protein
MLRDVAWAIGIPAAVIGVTMVVTGMIWELPSIARAAFGRLFKT